MGKNLFKKALGTVSSLFKGNAEHPVNNSCTVNEHIESLHGTDISSQEESDVTLKKENLNHVIDIFRQTTERDAIKIKLKASTNNILSNKFGGTPYLPHEQEVPVNSHGQQLHLLAQIRMDELPESQIGLPSTGMLQFWALDDDTTGLDFDYTLKADDYRIIYYPTIDETVTKEEIESKYQPYCENESYFPIQDEFGIYFSLEKEAMSYSDYQFEHTFIETWNHEYPDFPITDLDGLDGDLISDEFCATGHKMGGYPFFTQWDPREGRTDNLKILLLQIDTDQLEDKGIMWGDSGVANFFINADDLKQLDFSKVLYNWDCY